MEYSYSFRNRDGFIREIWLYKNTVQIPPLVVGGFGGLRRMFVKKRGQIGEARNWTCLMNKNRTVPRGRVRPMSCTVGGFGPFKPTRRDGSRGSSIVLSCLTKKIHISAGIASEADGCDPPLGKTQVGKRGIQHRCVFRSERMVWPLQELVECQKVPGPKLTDRCRWGGFWRITRGLRGKISLPMRISVGELVFCRSATYSQGHGRRSVSEPR